MSFFLRKIRKGRWIEVDEITLLDDGDLPADPLADLNTKDNNLSVWQVKEDESNLNEIVAALAAKSMRLSNFDYLLFRPNLPPKLNVSVVCDKGLTSDETVNNWHCDFVGLSAFKLIKLAKALLTQAEKRRILEKDVAVLIIDAMRSGRINLTSLHESLKKDLKKYSS